MADVACGDRQLWPTGRYAATASVEFDSDQATEGAAGPTTKMRADIKIQLKTTGFAFAVLFVLSGCSGAVKNPNHYTLHLPPPPDPRVAETVHATLAIREFCSPAYLRQGAIVYKTAPEGISFYNYHRWAMNPREFLTNAVADRLRASGSFAQVRIYDGHPTDYVLSGCLEELEEVDYQGGVKVRVAISAQLASVATGETVWTNSASEVGPVGQREVPAVVSAIIRDEPDDGAGD